MTVAGTDRLIEGYAQALFAIVEAEGDLDAVEDQLYRFAKAIEARGDLREALTDPSLPADRKKGIVHDLLQGKASDSAISLLGFLIEQGRAKDLPKIIEALADVVAERRNRAVAEVRTAVPLDAGQRTRLAEALGRATGKDIELKVLVDESLVGGIMARVGDQVYDGTIKRRLELAREQLAKAR